MIECDSASLSEPEMPRGRCPARREGKRDAASEMLRVPRSRTRMPRRRARPLDSGSDAVEDHLQYRHVSHGGLQDSVTLAPGRGTGSTASHWHAPSRPSDSESGTAPPALRSGMPRVRCCKKDAWSVMQRVSEMPQVNVASERDAS